VSRIVSGLRELPIALLADRAARAASGFAELGIGDGDTIALLLRNDFAYFEANLAGAFVGAQTTPINWHFTADEAGYILSDSQAKVLVAHADLLPRIAAAVPAGIPVLIVPTSPEICAAYGIADGAARPPRGAANWNEWLQQRAAIACPAPTARPPMIYTSGTTGRPKGVRKERPTPEQAAFLDKMYEIAFGLRAGEPIVALMNGPMYHSAPGLYARIAVRLGATLILQPRFEPEELLVLVERHRITHMHIVPTMFVRLLKLPLEVRRRYDLSSLRFVVHGAAPCPWEIKRAMIEWWGPVVHEYYGSTETGVATWQSAGDAVAKPGSVGRALPGVELRIVGDDGREVGPGTAGEIFISAGRLPDFTYHRHDDERQAIARGDMVSVGDVGWMDEDGYLFLCDRKRDMVISGGVNIYPAEIEAVLATMPGVRDCAVFGIPDAEFGEALCAYVQPEAAARIEPPGVQSYLAAKLAKFKLPKIVEIVDSLPREDSGKIFKRKLRAPYWAPAGRQI